MIAAYFHRARQGLALPQSGRISARPRIFFTCSTGETPSTEAVNTLDVAYVLHADHGMNASTFSARVTIATLSDIYSAITSAIGTLKGPLHGGANEGVIHMLLEIGSEDKVDAWVEEQLAQKKKIMGIGHRVYKVLDPRAPHLRAMAVKLSEELGEPKWIRMSERIARNHEGKERAQRERRFLFRHGLLLARHSDRHVHADFCHRADQRLDGSRPRATRRQSALPAPQRIRRTRRSERSSSPSTNASRLFHLDSEVGEDFSSNARLAKAPVRSGSCRAENDLRAETGP